MSADRATSSTFHSGTRLDRRRTIAGVIVALVLAACGGGLVPVHNVRAPIVAPHGQAHSLQTVREAIMRALLGRGWLVDREGPDGIVATVVSKGHSATVLVQFDAQSYAISYLDSSPGLKFNGGAIHRRYNDWIDRLDKTIRKELASSDAYPARAVAPAGAMPVQPAPTAPAAPAAPAAPVAEPAPATAPAVAPPPTGAPAVAPPGGPYEAPPPPPPPPPAPAPRR